jgi:phage-related baseplate assembly protein
MEVFADATADGDRSAEERIAAAVEAFARRALAGPTRAYALIAEPVDPRVEAERLTFRRGYRDVLAAVLRDGVDSGELAAHDTENLAAALVGAIGETLVGPLAPSTPRAARREALVAGLVQFCTRAIPKEASRAGDPAHA